MALLKPLNKVSPVKKFALAARSIYLRVWGYYTLLLGFKFKVFGVWVQTLPEADIVETTPCKLSKSLTNTRLE